MSKPIKLVIFILLFLALALFLSFQIKIQVQSPPLKVDQVQIDKHNTVTKIVDDVLELDVPEYVGMKVDEEEVSVDIWISSEPSKELFGFVQRFDVRGKDQPVVRLHRSPFTLKKLKEAQKKLESLVKNSQIGGGVVLSTLGTNPEGKGIDISLDVSSSTPDEQWISNLERSLGVPVFVNPEKTDIDLLYTGH